MLFNTNNVYYIKTVVNLNCIKNILREKEFHIKKSYYILEIYMKNKDNLNKIIKSKKDLEDYVLLSDINNETKQLTIFNKQISKSKVNNILFTKQILEKLNYLEVFHINYDIYEYINKNKEKISIIDLKENGLYIALNKETYKNTNILNIISMFTNKSNLLNPCIDILDVVIKNKLRGD